VPLDALRNLTAATRILTGFLLSALIGAGCLLWWQSSASASRQEFREQSNAREEVIPAQTLNVVRGPRQPIADIDVGNGLVSVRLFSGARGWILANVYETGRVYLACDGPSSEVSVGVDEDGLMVRDRDRGVIFAKWKESERVTGWASKIRRVLAPPPLGKKVDDVIPTKDLRLRNHQQWRFATLGLTKSGDPGIAFTDTKGGVRLAWVQRQAPAGDQDWWEFAIFDGGGHLRSSLELHPGQLPDLVVFGGDLGGQYYPDFRAGKLVPKTQNFQSMLLWLPVLDAQLSRPIQLLDNRHRTLWNAP